MLKTIKLMANLVIIGFVLGRAYSEWQHRPVLAVPRRNLRAMRSGGA